MNIILEPGVSGHEYQHYGCYWLMSHRCISVSVFLARGKLVPIFENYIFAKLRGVNAWKTGQKIILLTKNEELMNLSCQMIFLSDAFEWHFLLLISIYVLSVWNASLPIQILFSSSYEERFFFSIRMRNALKCHSLCGNSDERKQNASPEGRLK